MFDIADRLQQAGFGDRQAFLDVAVQEVSLIADLDPAAKSLEGYLFPDTYRFARRTALAEIAAAMVKRFRAQAALLGLKVNVHRTVTLASLVEKETAVDSETAHGGKRLRKPAGQEHAADDRSVGDLRARTPEPVAGDALRDPT